MNKLKTRLLSGLAIVVSLAGCVKEKQPEEQHCKLCEVRNSVGTKIDEQSVCDESAESALRARHSERNYTVTCR